MRRDKVINFFKGFCVPFLILMLIFCCPMNTYAESAKETIDLSENILQVGGLSSTNQDETADGAYSIDAPQWLSNGTKSIEDVIVSALKTKSEIIDLSSYKLDASTMFALYTRVVNKHPELFYVTGGVSYMNSGGYVSYIWPRYATEYSQEDIDVFNQRVAQIMAGVDSSWPTIEKILYLHDYLVTNVEYDQTYSKYNAYNALVEGSSVCQGYSLAFTCLMNNIGVNVDIITSRNLSHAWNLVELNGEYFYIDATWDDPLNTSVAYCGHDNFMVDRDSIVATGHNTSDWSGNISGVNVYNGIVTSARYNDFYWSDMLTPVPLSGTKAGFCARDQIMIYDFSTGAINYYDRIGSDQRWYDLEVGAYYSTNFCSMVAVNGAFYYTTPTGIYGMQLNGTVTKLYNLSDTEVALGRIYGLTASGRNLTYVLQRSPYSDTVVGTGVYRIKTKVDDFVTRMYEQCLGRKPDLEGLNGWASQLDNGYMDGASIAESFVFSQEMLKKNLPDEDFLKVLYRAMMGREADTAGLKGWLHQLQNGYMTRSQVTKSFVESVEFTNICNAYSIKRGTYDASMAPIEQFVTRFYTLCLERKPDQVGMYGWVGNLKNKYMNGAQIADAFFFSKEFVNRKISDAEYIELLYNTLMGRKADDSGKAGWLGQLQGGYMTRKEIMKAFIESTEFFGICERYGIIRGSL